LDLDLTMGIVVHVGLVLLVAWDAAQRCRFLGWIALVVLLTMLAGPLRLAVWLALRPAVRRSMATRWRSPIQGVPVSVGSPLSPAPNAGDLHWRFAAHSSNALLGKRDRFSRAARERAPG
jgi:hypothetical protein